MRRNVIPAQPGFDLILPNRSGKFDSVPIVGWAVIFTNAVASTWPLTTSGIHDGWTAVRCPGGIITVDDHIFQNGKEMEALAYVAKRQEDVRRLEERQDERIRAEEVTSNDQGPYIYNDGKIEVIGLDGPPPHSTKEAAYCVVAKCDRCKEGWFIASSVPPELLQGICIECQTESDVAERPLTFELFDENEAQREYDAQFGE